MIRFIFVKKKKKKRIIPFYADVHLAALLPDPASGQLR